MERRFFMIVMINADKNLFYHKKFITIIINLRAILTTFDRT